RSLPLDAVVRSTRSSWSSSAWYGLFTFGGQQGSQAASHQGVPTEAFLPGQSGGAIQQGLVQANGDGAFGLTVLGAGCLGLDLFPKRLLFRSKRAAFFRDELLVKLLGGFAEFFGGHLPIG